MITAIHGGGDWADASADYFVIPEGMSVIEEHKKYRQWYLEEYRKASGMKYLTFTEWLEKAGAKRAGENEIKIHQMY